MMSITHFSHATDNKTSLTKLRANAKPGRKLLTLTFKKDMSHDMGFPTMSCVRLAKAQSSLRIRAD